MAMFKKVAGKAKQVSKKDAERMVMANRQNRKNSIRPTEEEKEDEQPEEERKPE